MTSPIMVSIVCNAYNQEKYIRDALDGFIAQKTNFSFEILVHDDASTDSTPDIIREYEEKYPELVKPIYQKENQWSQKICPSRNHQAPRVKGKYVAICEGDDYWTDPEKLQKQFDFLEANPEYTMCTCSVYWQNMRTGVREQQGCIAQDTDLSMEELIEEKNGRIFQMASIFVRADLWVNWPSWGRLFPIGDYPLNLHAAAHGKVRMLADTMAVYRYYSEGSWTMRMDNDERRVVVHQRMIEGLNAFNEATEYRYQEAVTKRIKKHKYSCALVSHDYAALKSDELKDMYASRPFLNRMSDRIRCKHPKFYQTVLKRVAFMLRSIQNKRR